MKIQNMLNEEVQNQIEELEEMELGTEGYKTTVEGITKLTDRIIKMEELSLEAEKQLNEKEIAEKQIEEEKKGRKIQNCIAVAGIAIPTLVTIWGTKASFKFEQEGTITTIMGRGFINKLLPKK